MARRKPADPKATRDAELLAIAQRQFRIETLETQNWDRLDFHDVAVWAIRAALDAEALRQAKGACSGIRGVRGQIKARHRHADAQQKLAHDGQGHLVQTEARRAVAVGHGAPLKHMNGSCAKGI